MARIDGRTNDELRASEAVFVGSPASSATIRSPVASLDPVSARKVMEILRELNQKDGLTVIVTLHQVDYALKYCDRVVALKAGKIVYDGPASGLKTAQLIDIYGPEFEDVFWEGAPT